MKTLILLIFFMIEFIDPEQCRSHVVPDGFMIVPRSNLKTRVRQFFDAKVHPALTQDLVSGIDVMPNIVPEEDLI